MQLEGHAASAWQPSRGWGETGRTSDSAVDGERREADAQTAHLVEAPDAAEAFAEEPRPVTPDVLAGFDSAIRQLRSQIAELRTVLRERKVAGEHKKAQMATLNM